MGSNTVSVLASYTVQANGNRIVTRNGVTLTYDPTGNLLSDQTRLNGATVNRSFTYALSGALKTVSIGGVLRATYTYNAQNQRTRKVLANPPAGTPATTLYRYDTQGHLVEEIAGSPASGQGISVAAGQSFVTYVWKDDSPSAVIHAPNSPGNPGNAQERIAYLHSDHLESPRKATDSAGRVVWSWESDAFGSTAANEDPDGDGTKTVVDLRFPGQRFDSESGLHYNWHRYYDPLVGRYTQSDPIGLAGGANSFVYGLANPLTHADPTGENPAAAITAALAAAREAIKRCAKDAACRCRAICASYKAMCGVGCRGSSCEVLTVQARAATTAKRNANRLAAAMTLANDGAGSIDRVLLSALAASVSADELAALRTEAGFQDPNEFDFDSLIGPLSTCAFPAEHHCYDIMWAVHECGLSALERYSAPLRQYLAALYLHCNRLRAWGLNVEADYHHMLAAATLDAPSAAAPVMAFLERLADPVGAAEGFDPRLAHFGWLLLHCALGLPDTDASLAKRDLLFAPMHADLRADLGVAERSTEDLERLFVRACAKGGRSCGGFAELFFENTASD